MKKEFSPLISIIIPTFNRGALLIDTLESVRNQTYSQWECVIVDDGSTDNTAAIVKSFGEFRFKYYYKERGERSSARNFGLTKATGKYLQFLDSDDLITSKKLENSIKELNGVYNGKEIIISNFRLIKGNSKITFDPYCNLKEELFNFKDVLYNWDVVFTIPIHSAIFNSCLFKEFKFPTHINYKEDWLMWLSMFQQDLNIFFLDEPLALYRIREELSKEEKLLNDKNEIEVLKFLGDYIPNKDLLEYYLFLIEKKQNQILQLQNTVINYMNTRTFKSTIRLRRYLKAIKNKCQKWKKN